MTIQEFIDKYREAFGEAAPLPIALGYSDTPASKVGSVRISEKPYLNFVRVDQLENGRNQLWRNHLLAFQLMDSQSYKAAHFSVVHHRDNHYLDASMNQYREMISSDISLTSFTNDNVVCAAEKYGCNLTEWAQWYRGLYMI